MKRILSILVVIAMALTFSVSVAAATAPANETELAVVVGEAIGTHAEEDGILVEERATAASGLPFTMTAKSVSSLLTTYSSSGKNFTGGAFEVNEGLLIEGTLTHTMGYNMKVGACYYNSSNDTFYSVEPIYFDSGVAGSGFIPKKRGRYLNFHNKNTYYGHITNHNEDGRISGTLDFSVSTE